MRQVDCSMMEGLGHYKKWTCNSVPDPRRHVGGIPPPPISGRVIIALDQNFSTAMVLCPPPPPLKKKEQLFPQLSGKCIWQTWIFTFLWGRTPRPPPGFHAFAARNLFQGLRPPLSKNPESGPIIGEQYGKMIYMIWMMKNTRIVNPREENGMN